MENPRTYLLTVFIDSLSPEHARIIEAVKVISGGEHEVVHRNGGCFCFAFNSARPFESICMGIETATLNSDRFVLVEAGQKWETYGLNRAAGWIRNHLR